MLEKIKKGIAIILILILFPYIITIFMNGDHMEVKQDDALDDYCIGILANEVSPDYEDEMLKAQAVLVRTTVYASVKELDKSEIKKPKIGELWYQKLKRIWNATEGQVILYENELALVPFHKLSNGTTRTGKEVLGSDDYPYLQSKSCPADMEADEQIQILILPVANVEVTSLDGAGYVTEVKVGEETCSGDSFRDTYELPSSSFDIQSLPEKTRVITKGIGHGLGMSQYTANEMAKDGKSHEEILQFFFEGTEIREVAEILWDME